MTQQREGYSRRRKWCDYSRGTRIAVMVAAALVFVPAFFALFGAVTMWLWNWLMPAIFHLPTIGFWQAVGILALAQILFKGGHFRRAGRSKWKKERIRDRMAEQGPPFTSGAQGQPFAKDAQGEGARAE